MVRGDTGVMVSGSEHSIRPMAPSSVAKSVAIFDDELGRGYVSRAELERLINTESKVALISELGAVATGVATGEVLTYEEFLAAAPADVRWRVAEMTTYLTIERVGVLKSVAVSKRYQSRGLASSLCACVVQRLWDLGASCVVTVGWTTDSKCHIEGVVRSLGFREEGVIDDFWFHDSVVMDYQCPRCGQPCRCGAKVFSLQHQVASTQ